MSEITSIKDIIIREATDADSNAIIDLIFDIWNNEYKFDVNKADFPDLLNIEKNYGQSDGLFLVAGINNLIVGTIACDKLNENDFVLKRMFVNKEYRRLGVAQKLLDKLTSSISSHHKGIPYSFYLSTKENEAKSAKLFYLKNGFEVISRTELPENFPFFYKDDLFMYVRARCVKNHLAR